MIELGKGKKSQVEDLKSATEDVKDLEVQVDDLKDVIEKSVTNQSLMAFNDGRVEWYNISKNSYADHYTIYRGVNLLASLGSGLPFIIYRGDSPVESGVRLTPGNFDILNPHPFMSFNEIVYTALIYFFYRGEFMVEISEDPVFHLKPLNPQHMARETNKIDWRYSYEILSLTVMTLTLFR